MDKQMWKQMQEFEQESSSKWHHQSWQKAQEPGQIYMARCVCGPLAWGLGRLMNSARLARDTGRLMTRTWSELMRFLRLEGEAMHYMTIVHLPFVLLSIRTFALDADNPEYPEQWFQVIIGLMHDMSMRPWFVSSSVAMKGNVP